MHEMQKAIYRNKVDKGFNVTDVNLEFCLLYGEVGEAYNAWKVGREDTGEELADVAIYLMGLAEIVGVDLHDEIVRKMEINRRRKYRNFGGVMLKVGEEEDATADPADKSEHSGENED